MDYEILKNYYESRLSWADDILIDILIKKAMKNIDKDKQDAN